MIEILKLIEYIPVAGNLPSNGKLADNHTIDSRFYFESIGRNGSFRDIIRLIDKELAKEEVPWKNALLPKQRYTQLREVGCSYPIEYLLFDFCLAAMEKDYVDAGLYFAHSFHILDLSKPLNLLVSVVINERLAYDKDVTNLMVLLAGAIEPRNTEAYIDTYKGGFRRRYEAYRQELRKKGLII
jgi:hypothetical protein